MPPRHKKAKNEAEEILQEDPQQESPQDQEQAPVQEEVATDTEIEDTSTEMAADVKSFISEHDEKVQAANEEAQSILQESNSQDDTIVPENDLKRHSVHLETDLGFVKDQIDNVVSVHTPMKDVDVPITEDDKERYLRCVLNNVPVTLTQSLYGGRMSIICRAISLYEAYLVNEATFRACNTMAPEIGTIMLPAVLQKMRAKLQVIRINEEVCDYLKFSQEPGKLEEHVATLIREAEKFMDDTPVPRWRAVLHALNIFEHKLTRINELALERNFLAPGD